MQRSEEGCWIADTGWQIKAERKTLEIALVKCDALCEEKREYSGSSIPLGSLSVPLKKI